MGEGVSEVRCTCGKLLIRRRPQDVQIWALSRMVEGVQLCLRCAARAEAEAQERRSAVGRPKTIEQYPIIREDEQTIISWLQLNDVIGPNAVQILMAHALATQDIDKWLDTLRDPAADFKAQTEALRSLRTSAPDWRELCDARSDIMGKVEEYGPMFAEREQKQKKEKSKSK